MKLLMQNLWKKVLTLLKGNPEECNWTPCAPPEVTIPLVAAPKKKRKKKK